MTSATKSLDTTGGADKRHPPTTEFLRYLEEQAAQIRKRAGVGSRDRLDPWAVLNQLGLTILTADEVEGLTPEERARVRTLTPKEWSGGGMPLPNGSLFVLLHPDQTVERGRATILEEVAHEHYGHQPSAIITLVNGMPKRTFNERIEQEAYWTAAAALLPMKVIAQAVYSRKSAEQVARDYGTSVELVEFRIKILRLWKYHLRNAA